MQRVGHFRPEGSRLNFLFRHVHVSIKTKEGKNLFAVQDSEMENGRTDAQYEDTKWLSQEGEWFLAGVLDGLEDIVPMVGLTRFMVQPGTEQAAACSDH
jgi:hypothetical protein